MVMSAVGLAGSRWDQIHTRDTEFHGHLAADCGAIRRLDEEHTGVGRRGRSGLLDGYRIDPDMDDLGHDRRVVRNMTLVTQQELQRVLTCRQRDLRLGLTTAKMDVVEMARDRLIERRQLAINDTM